MIAKTLAQTTAKYGTGSIYPTGRVNKEGIKIYGIAFYYDDMSGKKTRKVITGREEELEQKREDFLNQYYEQTQVMVQTAMAVPIVNVGGSVTTLPLAQAPTCSLTLKEAIEGFLAQYEPTVSHQTFLGEKTCTNNITRIMGDMLVKDITFSNFQNLVNVISKGRNGKIAAPRTVQYHIISFKRIMKYCKKMRWITSDDFDFITSDIKIPTFVTDNGHEEKVKEDKALTVEEAMQVLNVLKNNRRYYLVAKILLLTGLRPQEFFTLETKDLVRDENYIHIRQALVKQNKAKANRTFDVGTTKNRASRRKVPATPKVFQYFDKLEKLLREDGSREKSFNTGNQDMVIVDSNGNLIDEHAFGVNMVRYQQRNGECKRFTLGMPRHFYQDQLDILGANVNDVEKAVGHVIDTVAQKHYKVNEEYLRRLLPYLEELGKMLG